MRQERGGRGWVGVQDKQKDLGDVVVALKVVKSPVRAEDLLNEMEEMDFLGA